MTKERKYILIAGCFLLLVGVVYRYYPFEFEFFNDASQIAIKQKKIQKYSAVIQQKPYIDKLLLRVNSVAAKSANVFLKGKTPALAAVDIQNILNRIAERVDINIIRIDVRKKKQKKKEGIIRIPVNFRMSSTTEQLRDFIFYIRSSEKLIRIIDIKVNRKNKKGIEQVSSNITLEGFIRE